MKKFQVTYRRSVYAAMIVEAEDEYSALDIADARVREAPDGEPSFDEDNFEPGDWEQMTDFGAEECEQ